MTTQYVSCTAARQMDMVDYLATLGFLPTHVKGNDHWFLSPFRDEQTASFKIDRRLNLWYDHGQGIGGDIIDFGTAFYRCSVKEFLQHLQHSSSLSFQQPQTHIHKAVEKKKVSGENDNSKIKVIDVLDLQSDMLKNYLDKRAIPFEIANRFCKEIHFRLYNKSYTAIGFQNSSGGYELRSENFKGSSSPKTVSFIDNKTENMVVFEGFFSFLSFQAINKNLETPTTNCLVLNSLAFFEKSRLLMEQYKQVHLLLDNDAAGKTATAKALQWSNQYINRSDFYKHYKDLNEWLIKDKQIKQLPKQGIRRAL